MHTNEVLLSGLAVNCRNRLCVQIRIAGLHYFGIPHIQLPHTGAHFLYFFLGLLYSFSLANC